MKTCLCQYSIWSFLLPLVSCFYDTTTRNYIVYVIQRTNDSRASGSAVLQCAAMGAHFGDGLPPGTEMIGCAMATTPRSACAPLSLPSQNSTYYCLSGAVFAVIPRGNCSFAKKAWNAQSVGFSATIITNYPGHPPETMTGDGEYGSRVLSPVLMISHECGKDLLEKFPFTQGYDVVIRSPFAYGLLKYLIPFLSVVGLCFLIMIVALIVKFVRERRRQSRRRLSRRNLRKIPTKKYKKGSEPETCPICLDDFDDGDRLRILPCQHAYHSKCVDPWLTKNRKVCPVCKRKVMPGAGDSDSDSTEDTASTSNVHSESTQLIPESPSLEVGQSRFYGQYRSTGETEERAQQLSPPSSPETPSSSSGHVRLPKINRLPRRIVPGFLRGDRGSGSSTEQLVVPPPPEEVPDEGVPNPGYVEAEAEATARRPRRKRHLAADKKALATPPTRLYPEESDEEKETEEPAASSELPRARTKKKRSSQAATSAPATLDVASSSEDAAPSRTRDDSIQLEMDLEEEELTPTPTPNDTTNLIV